MRLTDQQIATVIEDVNRNPELVRRGKYYSVRFAVAVGDELTNFIVEDGRLIGINHDGNGNQFTIQTDADSWTAFREDEPRPGYQDISALVENRDAKLSGDIKPWLSNMLYVKGIIDAWRRIS